MLKLAVIGDPVAHSASPDLHRGFLLAAGIEGSYEAIRVVAGDAARAVTDLRRRGYAGVNVTTPLKEEAFALAHERDPAALAAGSANTLVLGERIVAYNTDGIGAIGALRNAGLDAMAGKHILVLGTGPTARSCVASFVAAGARVAIWNRTLVTAEIVAVRLGAVAWAASDATPDAVVSALPPNAVLDDPALVSAVGVAALVIDANYGPRATLGTTLRLDVYDGSEMLRASAAASFAIFTSNARDYRS